MKLVKQATDCFNGLVELIELEGTIDNRFVVKQHRKNVTTEALNIEAAEYAFSEFVNDTMF